MSRPHSAFQIKRSIIRRSVLLLLLVFPGFVLNYGLLHGASRLLELDVFGVFYTSISIIGTLFAPAIILGFYFARQMSEGRALNGPEAALAVFRRFSRGMVIWGLVGMMVLAIAMVAIGSAIGVESIPLVAAIAFATFTSYLVECVRSGLQGMQRFGWLGGVGLLWMLLKFGLGLAGIVLLQSAWGGVLGTALAGIPVFLVFRSVLLAPIEEGAREEGAPKAPRVSLSLGPLPLFMASFGVFAVLCYLDIIIAYVLLERVELGVYSASAALPKAVIVLALPIVQVLFPVLVGDRVLDRRKHTSLWKGLALTAVFCVTGAGGLHLFDDLFCTSSLGLRACSVSLLGLLVWSTVPLALVRVLVLHQLARRRDWHPQWLVIPAAAFCVYCVLFPPSADELARNYLVFGWATAAFYGFSCVPWSEILTARTRL